jgi:hypothetical protein
MNTTTVTELWRLSATELAKAVNGPLARRIADLQEASTSSPGQPGRDPRTVPAPLRGPKPVKSIRATLTLDPSGHGTAVQVHVSPDESAASR